VEAVTAPRDSRDDRDQLEKLELSDPTESKGSQDLKEQLAFKERRGPKEMLVLLERRDTEVTEEM